MNHVLVTGASSGIGSQVAQEAARRGWGSLVGYASGEGRAQALVQNIHSSSGCAWPVSLSLQTTQGVDRGLDQIANQGLAVDAVVLCASPPPVLASFLKTTPDQLVEQWTVNVAGNHYLLTQVWKRFFRKNKGGHIVAVLSAAIGSPPWPHMTAYVAAKRGLQSIIESALSELAVSGLRATLIHPDYTETPMLLNQDPRVVETARSRTPEGKFLSPEAVANVIVDALQNPPTSLQAEMKSVSLVSSR